MMSGASSPPVRVRDPPSMGCGWIIGAVLARNAQFILDRAHNAVIALDERGVVTYWNPRAEQMFCIAREAAVGRRVAELIIPERFRKAHFEGIERFLREGVGPVLDRRIELSALGADGREFPVEMTITALQESGHWSFTAFVQDISERKASEAERERLTEELRRSLHSGERRFDAIVGALEDPVTIRDREGKLVYANPAAVKLAGLSSLDDLLSAGPDAVMARSIVLGEDGTELSIGDLPSTRILRGEPAEPLRVRMVSRTTGEQRWLLLKAGPVLDDVGELEATIMVTEDVTDQKLAEQRAAFLARASEVLASSLDYEQTLRNVAELAVPEVVDWCAVDLVGSAGERIPVAVAHVDPARLALAEKLRRYDPARLDPDRGLGLVFRTGETQFYPEITDEMLVESAADDRQLEMLREVGFRSAIIVPMRLGRRTLGAMTMVTADSGRALTAADVELAEQIAARAAVAIENARLFSERSAIAHTLQQSLLPARLPEIPGYELASLYIPAVAGSEVGGDFYDVWQVDDAWLLVIGDVVGKGIAAASLTSLVRNTLRVASDFLAGPAELLAYLDRTLKAQSARSLCTALCIRMGDGRITLAVGGHPLPVRVGASGIVPVGEHGSLLGGFSDAEWHETAVTLEPGETLIAYTDGVTDAVGQAGERFGMARLSQALESARERPAGDLVASLTAALESFQEGDHADDIAVLALRRLAAVNHVGGEAEAGVDSTLTTV